MAGVSRVGVTNSFLSASSQTTATGALSGDLIYTQATVTLTAGVWRVTATAGVLNATSGDDTWVSVYNRTTSALVAGSYGTTFFASNSTRGWGQSFPVTVTVTTTADFCPQVHRNAASTISVQKVGNSIAGGISAIRIS